jgi:anion-transporting  ArsA/GET3 family ATPase
VAMCNAKERLSVMLGSDVVTDEVSLVAPNLWAVNMDPEKALEEYGILTRGSTTPSSSMRRRRATGSTCCACRG